MPGHHVSTRLPGLDRQNAGHPHPMLLITVFTEHGLPRWWALQKFNWQGPVHSSVQWDGAVEVTLTSYVGYGRALNIAKISGGSFFVPAAIVGAPEIARVPI